MNRTHTLNAYARTSLKVSRLIQLKVCLVAMLLTVFQIPAKGNSSYAPSRAGEQGDTVRKTIPYTLPWDDMPIDLSFVYEEEKPAGKHGFLKVVGDRFIFEDGTDARFWGTNFNSA